LFQKQQQNYCSGFPSLLLLLLFNNLPPDITGGQGLKKTFLSIFFTVQKHNNYDGI